VNYVRDPKLPEAVVRSFEDRGVEAVAVQGDVSDLKEAEALIAGRNRALHSVDILVCTAGIWEGAPIEEMLRRFGIGQLR